MKAIVTRSRDDGTLDNVGMTNRMIVSDLKTVNGIMKRAKIYAGNKHYRLQIWYADNIYGDPDEILTFKGSN